MIKFEITTNQKIITPATPLPEITGPVTIDGTTQAGYTHVPLVEINGAKAGNGAVGLLLTGGASTVRALRVTGFDQSGITLPSNGGNAVESCYLGLAADGNTTKPNFRVNLTVSSDHNRIGGTTAAQRNVIAASNIGVYLVGPGNNTVAGNYNRPERCRQCGPK